MKNFKIILFFLLNAGIQPFCLSTGTAQNPTQPNIVWITSEDNSTHYMSLFDEHGASTPHIAALAEEGLLFTHAFSNAPVCSVARSTLITGCYAPRIGAQFHRKIRKVPMPQGLKMFPEYLRDAGYYTTNNSKEDYNLEKSPEVWDESSKNASWKNRAPGQPFFHMVNITVTHESSLHFSEKTMSGKRTKNSMADVFVLPNHPDTELFQYTNAYYRDRIQMMDSLLGNIVSELEQAGELENTIIFYFGDHGGVLPGSKGYLYETGLHVPLVIYVPPKFRKIFNVKVGSKFSGFVSFIDFGPTVLSLAGIRIPEQMDGRPFLGKKISLEEVAKRDETYSYADRFDEKYDLVRAVRKGRYKYIRSFQPYNVDGLMNNYRYRQLAYQEWDSLYCAGALNKVQSQFFQPRPPELLFDLENDPYETHNLADDQGQQKKLLQLRSKLNKWMTNMPDLSLYPEYILINEAFENPVGFGQSHNNDIKGYLETANLCLKQFSEVKKVLEEALSSIDPWKRYWALIACASIKNEVSTLTEKIKEVSQKDKIPLNRVQAALFLALKSGQDPSGTMTRALYAARYPAEGLQILNTIVLMKDWGEYLLPSETGPVNFHINPDKINKAIREDSQVQRRLEYLGLL